ncbi:C40 family peptidase [Nocardia brasiliensis]|uniref:C40 family peptidase n=1 Tax=Nocardia brasiliensis TaxID=37326 RepID=UPI003D919DD7
MADSGGAVEREIRFGGFAAEVTVDERGIRAELSVPQAVPPTDYLSAPPEAVPEAPAGASPTTDAPEKPPPPSAAPPLPPLDPYLVSTALSAGLATMAALPMIALALSSPNAGIRSAGGVGGLSGGVSLGGLATAISPEQLRAQHALRVLAEVYGDQEPSDPRIAELRERLGVSGDGNGMTEEAIRARRLYQRTKAVAFNNLDNALYFYIQQLAQNNAVDQQAIRELLDQLNSTLAELGPKAYTATGQQYVHAVVTTAMDQAQRIVAEGNVSAEEMAAAINELTKQYLNNIAGRDYSPDLVVRTSGGSPAQIAAATAKAQIGKPYVWGAEGPNSFDCSGLVQFSAKAAGGHLPRTAAEQYDRLPKLGATDVLSEGDLVFPVARFENGRAKHVLMYIGNGRCIEAPMPGGNVREVPLPDDFRAARWAS